MSNEEFDNLKEELMWEGSSVVMLSTFSYHLNEFFYDVVLCNFFKIPQMKMWLMCNAGSDEQKFLEASMAYVAGNPIMSDKEFDNLKIKLKVGGSCFSWLACISMQITDNRLAVVCGFSLLSCEVRRHSTQLSC